MGIFRSEEMVYCDVLLPPESARDFIDEMGNLGVLQFVDLNHGQSAFQRAYINYIKRCDEMERKLRYFEQEITKHNIPLVRASNVEEFLTVSATMRSARHGGQNYLDELEATLEQHERELSEMNDNYERLNRQYNERIEFKHVLSKVSAFLGSNTKDAIDSLKSSASAGGSIDLLGMQPGASPSPLLRAPEKLMQFDNIVGVINTADQARFQRVLFRTTRGNCFTYFAPIEETIVDPVTNTSTAKSVFIILYLPGATNALENKIKKICDLQGARRYEYPKDKSRAQIADMQRDLVTQLQEAKDVNERTNIRIMELLTNLAKSRDSGDAAISMAPGAETPSIIEDWKWTVMKEKSIYHTLNMFVYHKGHLRGECWCPAPDHERVAVALNRMNNRYGNTQLPASIYKKRMHSQPPTHFRLSDFTWAFQEIVNTYGIPSYQEANPALFTTITFPFLFGVMFGDMGHGFLLAMFGAFLIYKYPEAAPKLKPSDQMAGLFKARYLLCLMGCFAFYAGLIYNEFFSVPLNLFGSSYNVTEQKITWDGSVYPIGLDPAWHVAENELMFVNSLKMKLSVILGVMQMSLGICLKLTNALHFKRPLDVIFEFIPQIIFMMALFGYMVLLIFMKWTQSWAGRPCPNVINILINMPLAMGGVAPGDQVYEGQESVQKVLICLALFVVPLMLFPKPLILNYLHKKSKQDERLPLTSVNDSHGSHGSHGGGHGHGDHGEFDFGEVFIHQAIETIEFVLGTVSNTASYLRLWALSLAHAQLAKVFFEKGLLGPIESGNVVMIVIGFGVFAGVSFGVLMCMDVLECFLHALRLHWVEFQNKFYKAEGYKFAPFEYKTVLLGSA
eukprot:GILI01001737.1.p1 GENE.GILI01001737.1~~GILI01001737.1.p1  ORF type:complete len:847 (+),score=304.50 GILI01001737.1:163-2703(+)